VLKTTVARSITGAFQGQLRPQEQLFLLPCSPTITTDHQIGEEAAHVTVTVAETCSAVAYNTQELTQKAVHLLSTTASERLKAGYNVTGAMHMITSVRVQKGVVALSVTIQGMLIYQFTPLQAHTLTSLLSGKTKHEAVHTLMSVPGIARASIAWNDDTKLPKDPAYIHVHIIESA
jgi:hypothetical protein